MRWVSVANDHLGPKPLISDSATRRSLWPLECQPVALDDNEWQISKTLIQISIQTHGQVSKKSYFDIWRFLKSYCLLRLIWELDPRSRSWSRSHRSRYILPGAWAGAGAAKQLYSEPEPEPTKNVTAPHPCVHNHPSRLFVETSTLDTVVTEEEPTASNGHVAFQLSQLF